MTFPLLNGEPWTADALCAQVDAELFYPVLGDWITANEAKRVCGMCPVASECLDYAIARNEPYGIWGGQSERQRRKMKTRLRKGDVA